MSLLALRSAEVNHAYLLRVLFSLAISSREIMKKVLADYFSNNSMIPSCFLLCKLSAYKISALASEENF